MTGAEFKALRKAMGLTLDECGLLLGYTGTHIAQTVHALETGRRDIRYEIGHLLMAIALGYEPKWAPAEVLIEVTNEKAEA